MAFVYACHAEIALTGGSGVWVGIGACVAVGVPSGWRNSQVTKFKRPVVPSPRLKSTVCSSICRMESGPFETTWSCIGGYVLPVACEAQGSNGCCSILMSPMLRASYGEPAQIM